MQFNVQPVEKKNMMQLSIDVQIYQGNILNAYVTELWNMKIACELKTQKIG